MLFRKTAIVLAFALGATIAVPGVAASAAPAGTATEQTSTHHAPASSPAAAGPADVADNPVIIVGGLSGFAFAYSPLAARLDADGFRPFIYELPGLGFGDIPTSARAFADYVDQVRATTGAARVDLVGHSEGGLVARYYLKRLGGTGAVGRYVSLGSPQHGTYVANIIAFLGLGSCAGVVACQQMAIGSDFLANLNAGDDTPGSVSYTTIRTWQDQLVRPVDNAALADGASNVLIQGWCPLRVVGHLGLALDGTTYTVIRQALRDESIHPNCWAV
ncbi:esterase/lipase family protein [Salinispora mooreana]|uniref:esterase/lipase family protein n=1 Tax=Salinispora mooreana TaxID=999545 RepID=UPI0003611E44|nr:alpha/beta fold hydrolase [Salinispora mooreana]